MPNINWCENGVHSIRTIHILEGIRVLYGLRFIERVAQNNELRPLINSFFHISSVE